jgi:hypothetical protein
MSFTDDIKPIVKAVAEVVRPLELRLAAVEAELKARATEPDAVAQRVRAALAGGPR